MKNTLLIYFMISLIPSCLLKAQDNCYDDISEINNNYILLKEEFESKFISYSIDESGNLTSDGIGTWDPNLCLYTEAGKNLPINNIGFEPHLNHFGDTGIRLGQNLVQLSLEYNNLLKVNSLNDAEITKKKIFLTLQTIRRLDKTANKMMEIFHNDCNDCNNFVPNLSGYSGFIIRDDAHFNVGNFCSDCPQHSHSEYVNFANFLTDNGLCTPNSSCDNICCFGEPRAGTNGNVCSQDQLIGILYGLAFAKKYVSNEIVSYNGTDYILSNMIDNMSFGINNYITGGADARHLRYPGCNNSGDKIEVGGNTTAIYYGIANTISNITGTNINTTSTDFSLWHLAIGGTGLGISQLFGNTTFNLRMFLKLKVGANQDIDCSLIEDDMLITGMFTAGLELFLLHGNDQLLNCGEHSFLICELFNALNTIKCDKICFDTSENPEPGCLTPNDTPSYCWCDGGLLESNECCTHATDALISPLEYLFIYNVLSAANLIPGGNIPLSNMEVETAGDDIIFGEPKLCFGNQPTYFVTEDIEGGSWSVSGNLSIISQDESSIVVELNNSDDQFAYISYTVSLTDENGCTKLYRQNKKIQTNINFAELEVDNSECFLSLNVVDGTIIDFEVMPNIEHAVSRVSDFITVDVVEYVNSGINSISFQIEVLNDCGETQIISSTIDLNCDLDGSNVGFVKMFPNPSRSTDVPISLNDDYFDPDAAYTIKFVGVYSKKEKSFQLIKPLQTYNLEGIFSKEPLYSIVYKNDQMISVKKLVRL